ncbi:MAG TPA: hypothetical protein VMB49_05110 [Acidobacteriaceae bacterium]|nr:hypothetical protein [Acidobacteriaceae bacterium]
MTKRAAFLAVSIVLFLSHACAEPIAVDPANPHYYLFHGKPTILITSAEHYGAIVNLDFDYVAYLDALKAHGLNYTRVWPGAVLEMVGEFCPGNTMGPRPDRTIVPWARSNQPGYVYGGNKFDLDKWNPQYFARLKDFIAKAAERGIVVEICFFNSQYTHRWPLSPLYYENNIQGVGKCDFKDAQTLKQPDLVQRESDYVSKITREVNEYDNVILEVCDEPALFTAYEDAGPWVGRLLEVVHNTESTLPKKHLLAQMVQGPIGGPIDFSGNPILSVIVGQYVWGGEAGREQMGGMKGLDYEYHWDKPIELNETPYYPYQYRVGDPIAASRVEAWEFIVGGGASFNHLNARFTAENPAGNTPDNEQILSALGNLKQFIYSFEFEKMHADQGFVLSGVPRGVYCRGISQPAEQYALYLHHSALEEHSEYYVVEPGHYHETLVLDLPPGTYEADWVDPVSGSVISTTTFTHQGGNQNLTSPEYSVDIALRIKRRR